MIRNALLMLLISGFYEQSFYEQSFYEQSVLFCRR